MKLRLITSMVLTAIIVFATVEAKAVSIPTVVYTNEASVSLGEVNTDTEYKVLNSVKKTGPASSISGMLPSMSMITFSYTINNLTDAGAKLLVSQASYDYYDVGGKNFWGSALADSTGFTFSENYIDEDTSSVPLIFATSNLTLTSKGNGLFDATGITTIKNLSADLAKFLSMFSGGGFANGGFIHIVGTVSAVPLPAALPLFGFGLAGLAGVSRFRKSRKSI